MTVTDSVNRPKCLTCNGSKNVACQSCKGTKQSAYIGAEVCELCDENGQEICPECGGTGMQKADSVEQMLAWYAKGERDFAKTSFPTNGRLSYGHLDLSGINLAESSLPGFQFLDTNFSGANLSRANLTNIRLSGCTFDHADISLAKLDGAEISDCSFLEARLRYTRFSGAKCTTVDFTRSDLSHAALNGAILSTPSSRDALEAYRDTDAANLCGAKLLGADLSGAILRGVSLERADLRAVKGLRLDSNFIKGARFSPGAKDWWSKLRRKYTGPMFAFHFFILVCFLIPYGLQTGYWIVVNKTQTLVEAAEKKIVAIPTSSSSPPSEGVRAAIVPDLRGFKLCPPGSCHEVPIWQLLLGLDQGFLNAILPIALILYNICRAILTSRVSLLREEEERSGFTPAFTSYRRLAPIHWAYSSLVFVAACALIWHLYKWLTISVWVQP